MDTTPDIAASSLIESVLTLTSTRVVATVTPDIAARLLATVDLNVSRRMQGANIQHLARAMREGSFIRDSAGSDDPMTIGAAGNLRNGKQRLVALIISGTTQTFTFTLHTDPEER
jgi:hypothetical protein